MPGIKADDIKKKAKEINEKINEKVSPRVKKLCIVGLLALIVFSVVFAIILNRKEYSVLYPSVTEEEGAEIVQLLQDSGVPYQYKNNGDILVDKKQEDTIRAQLAMQGYPKNAFAYSTFIDNAGGMSTDSDKRTYKLYDLQDRLGGTIGLFTGVKDAKVTIALGETQKYVLQDADTLTASTAQVTVRMEDGGSPTAEQTVAIQRLVAFSVAGMEMENVVVVDGNGIDMTLMYAEQKDTTASSDEIARMVESQVVAKVKNVLEPIYGEGNVRVSVKSDINMEELIRETLTYYTPEKIDEEDKRGLVTREEISEEMGEGYNGDGGVVGTETNSDITQYAGSGYNGNTSYSSSSEIRDFAINQVKEQGQVPAGAVRDLTVAVSINGTDLGSLTPTEVRDLVANAAGVYADQAENKITVVSAPFYNAVPVNDNVTTNSNLIAMLVADPWLLLIAGIIFLVLLLLIVLLLVLRRRRKKKKKKKKKKGEQEAPEIEVPVEVVLPEKNPEITKIQNEKAQTLRDSVRDFTEQNPEIAAQLLKNWLNGGDGNGDGRG